MSDVTQILSQIEAGDPSAAEKLLPIVYEDLRKRARALMALERPDHTLQATALVHDAYIRLVGTSKEVHWDNRGHFFCAAAEAMRRILIDSSLVCQSGTCGRLIVLQSFSIFFRNLSDELGASGAFRDGV